MYVVPQYCVPEGRRFVSRQFAATDCLVLQLISLLVSRSPYFVRKEIKIVEDHVYENGEQNILYIFGDIVPLCISYHYSVIQGGSNMTGTDLYVNKPHCAAAVRP